MSGFALPLDNTKKAFNRNGTMPPARFTLDDYWQVVGTDTLKVVLAEAGIDFNYFKLMSTLFKPCTPIMFSCIERAARQITPGVAPDYELCTRPERVIEQIRNKLLTRDATGLRQRLAQLEAGRVPKQIHRDKEAVKARRIASRNITLDKRAKQKAALKAMENSSTEGA